jgi:spore coat polysaccharide biosynthesis predicted glycosyltransferase SpsG/CMP-N-acetylneuraminic acid synthetase
MGGRRDAVSDAEEHPLCIIPARGTSPGLPKRHFKHLDGKPLLAHSIDAARDSDAIERVFVSTEDAELADIARTHGAEVPFLRPATLSEQDVLLYEVIQHAVDRLAVETDVTVGQATPIVLLQPNVPFRRANDIDAALAEYDRPGVDSVLSVVEDDHFYWRREDDRLTPRFEARNLLRSELDPFYRETGSIYVTGPDVLADDRRVGDEPGFVVTDRLSAFEVNSVMDFWMAEQVADGPTLLFRVDGGGDIGMGHVYRCLTLAEKLEARMNCAVVFCSNASYEEGIRHIRQAGYAVDVVDGDPDGSVICERDADIVFFDVLNTDSDTVRRVHESAAAVVNLEDLAGGLDHADFVVNALYEREGDAQNHLFGADYFVLRDEFQEHATTVDGPVENLVLTFGGSDPTNLSATVLRALDGRDRPPNVRLVLGADYGGRERLSSVSASMLSTVEIHDTVEDMAAMLSWADMAVAAGGRTVYELAATGTPAVVLAQNDREADRMRALDDAGVVRYLGRGDAVDEAVIGDAIVDLATDEASRRRLSDRATAFVDGHGTSRILDLVHDILVGGR